MNALPRPDLSCTPGPSAERFNTPSPLKPIKIGPTQNPQINKIRSFEWMMAQAEDERQFENNADYMSTIAKRVKALDVNK